MQRQGEGSRDTHREPCLTLLLLLSPDSLLLCSFSSALLLQGAWQRHWISIMALTSHTVPPHYRELCFIECEPPSLFLKPAEGALVQFLDIKQGAKWGNRWGEKPFDDNLSSHFCTWQHSFLSKSDSGFSFSSTDDLSIQYRETAVQGLTILSLRATSSSSSFLLASKWLSIKACSSIRSLFCLFFWMS